jgi:hypothetical protein
MDPVDLLTVSASAAQILRTARDPEAALASAYGVLGRESPCDFKEHLAIRITRLMVEAGPNRRDVMQHLRQHARGPSGNRPPVGSAKGAEQRPHSAEPDPEALRLRDFVDSAESGRDVFREGFGPFEIVTRSVPTFFGGRTIVERNGERLDLEEAGELQTGDRLQSEPEGLPAHVRALIDYPFETPILFEIRTGNEPWSVWDICCAFADQYEKIFEDPERYGIWGHDLMDLWIERLVYFPEERLLYAHIGS